MKTYGKVKVYLISELDWWQSLAAFPGCSTPGLWAPLGRKLGGFQNRVGQDGEEGIPYPWQDFNHNSLVATTMVIIPKDMTARWAKRNSHLEPHKSHQHPKINLLKNFRDLPQPFHYLKLCHASFLLFCSQFILFYSPFYSILFDPTSCGCKQHVP